MKKKLFFCSLLLAAMVIGIIACQKAYQADSDQFKVSAAKEWYYSVFKKSPEWSLSNLRGRKLPDWKNGVYQRIGSIELVEFPLSSSRKRISVTGGNLVAGIDQSKVAEASLNSIVFLKRGNQIIVRELTYIPDAKYLARSSFDISKAILAKGNSRFSGRLVIKDWAGRMLKTWLMADGVRIKKAVFKPNNATQAIMGSAASENCTTYEVCEYEQVCTEYWSGDVLIDEECTPWEPTGNCWLEEYCDGGSCGPEQSEEECACSLYGFCDDGGGGGGYEEEEDCNETISKQIAGSPSTETESITLESSTADSRTKNYKWVIYKQTLNMWKFLSHDKGVHKTVGNDWQWQSLTHENISRVGMVVGGSLECQLNSATPEVGTYNAVMGIDATINVSVACKGSPFSTSINFTTAKVFHVND